MKDGTKGTQIPQTTPRQSWTFSPEMNSEIRRAAATGIYDIRGGGSKRRVPHFDDLLVLGASISRYPLEGYRERCDTKVVLGDAGDALGDSLYEARLFVRGSVKSLGADCIEKEMRPEHIALLRGLLERGAADGTLRPLAAEPDIALTIRFVMWLPYQDVGAQSADDVHGFLERAVIRGLAR